MQLGDSYRIFSSTDFYAVSTDTILLFGATSIVGQRAGSDLNG